MVVRGRLAFDDQGRLVEISETANDPNNPQPSEIDPVEFDELIAQTAAAQNLDATQLASSLDAAGYDLSNVGAFDSTSVSTETLVDVADYIVSTDDDINDIINNQLVAGETVWLADGTHTVTKSGVEALAITVDNVQIAGTRDAVLKLEDNASTDDATGDDDCIVGIGAKGGPRPSGVVLEGFTIDGNQANQTTTGSMGITGVVPFSVDEWTVRNVEIHDATNGGIKSFNNATVSSNGTVRNCYVHNVHEDGIFLQGDGLKVIGCRVEDLPNQDALEPLGTNQKWAFNTVRNCAGQGVDCFAATDTTVVGNTIIVGPNGPRVGVSFDGDGVSGDAYGCTAIGNVVIGSNDAARNDHGFRTTTEAQDCTFVGNVSRNAGAQSEIRGDTSFKANEIIDPTGNGLLVADADNDVIGNTIRGGGGRGIRSTGTNAKIAENVVKNSSKVAYLVQGDNSTVEGNKAKSPDGVGFFIQFVGGGTVADNQSISATNESFYIENCDDLLIDTNKAQNGGSYSLRIEESDGNAHVGIVVTGYLGKDNNRGVEIKIGTGSIDEYCMRDIRLVNIKNTPLFVDQSSASTRLIENVDGYTESGGGEQAVDDGGTIAHGLSETPDRYNVESRDAGEIAHVTTVDGTNLTVEVLTVSDGSTGGTGNNVVWEAKTDAAP